MYLWYVVQYFSWYSDEMTGHISEILQFKSCQRQEMCLSLNRRPHRAR
jgi:hypothetical protein